MQNLVRYADLGHNNFGWLDARHHFSFGSYYDPNRMSFGKLRVINDDVIKPKMGFDTHPHKDMEIITYVRQGAITHRDSMNNEGRTKAGDVQVMSAGKGVYHSEYNLEDEDTNLYQIWIEPNQLGITPQWDAKSFPMEAGQDKLSLIVSGDFMDDNALHIHADAKIYAGRFDKEQSFNHILNDRSAYVLASKGNIQINNTKMNQGDGLEVSDEKELNIQTSKDSEILLIELI